MATITGTAGGDTENDTVGTSDLYDMQGGADTVYAGGGNDTLEGGTGNDRLYGGLGDDYLYAGAFGNPDSDSLDGGGGSDTVDFSLGNEAININLALGGNATFNPPDGPNDTDSLVGIENIVGTNFADVIDTGTDTVSNVFFGGSGNDSLLGGTGNDTLYGGNDADSLSGEADADLLYGGAGVDTLFGGDANDTLIGGAGADIIDGDGGTDTASYVDSGSGVVVTVNSIGTGGTADGDTLFDIENLTGSGLSDALFGNSGNNVLDGGGGNDLLMGGSGNDTLIGGSGTDTASFAGSTTAVNASLATGIATGEGTDSLSGVENLVGTLGNDTLTGDDAANQLTGGLGNDSISAAGGNDTVLGGAGNDTVDGGSGNDLIYGGGNAETSSNFIQNGSFTGLAGTNGGGNWTGTDLEFNPESAYFGSAGSSNVVAEIDGNAGQITVMNQNFTVTEASSAQLTFRGILRTQGTVGLDGYRVDIVDASNNVIFSQTILPGSNVLPNWTNYSLNFDFPAAGTYTLRFTEIGDGDSLGALVDDVQITSIVDGADLLNGGDGTDTIFGGAGADTISGDANADLLYGDTGNDTLSGGTGDDTLYGGVGQDTLSGGDDNDVLYGGVGNDSLDGGNGNDTLRGGDGPDTLRGGAGNDLFRVETDEVLGTGNDIFDGGGNVGEAIATDNDTIDFSVYGWNRVEIDYTSTDPLNLVGTITIYDAAGKAGGVVIGQIDFNEIETLVCFTPGTLILTDHGEVAVETLVAGDKVVTRDRGVQELRWVGKRALSMLDLLAQPELRPVRIAKGAFGAAGPDRTMLVSPQHRVLIEGARAELLFGEAEVLVPAKHLVSQIEATRALPEDGVVYIHILFDRHEIVQSDGIWTESFQPAERTLSAMDAYVRAEVLALFPALQSDADNFDGARLSLKAHEARVLLAR